MHPLADKSKYWIELEFVHTNDTKQLFQSYINDLTGDRLTWFRGESPRMNHTIGEIKNIVKNIMSKSKEILSIKGHPSAIQHFGQRYNDVLA